MYNGSAPPKGYSVPRGETRHSERRCQKCLSTKHWSYECKEGDVVQKRGKLSQTQMLKYGLKRKRTEFEPEETEKDKVKKALDEVKDLEKMIKQDKETGKKAEKSTKKEDEPTPVKKEKNTEEEEDNRE